MLINYDDILCPYCGHEHTVEKIKKIKKVNATMRCDKCDDIFFVEAFVKFSTLKCEVVGKAND